jgi:hypothetical protein
MPEGGGGQMYAAILMVFTLVWATPLMAQTADSKLRSELA